MTTYELEESSSRCMNRFDLCIIESSDKAEYLQAYAFILDMEDFPDLHVEIWNFERLDGATVDYINASCLRTASKEKTQEYQRLLRDYLNTTLGCNL